MQLYQWLLLINWFITVINTNNPLPFLVKVYVEIEDANGATMPVCPTVVTVKPKGAVGPTTIEEVLYVVLNLSFYLSCSNPGTCTQISLRTVNAQKEL